MQKVRKAATPEPVGDGLPPDIGRLPALLDSANTAEACRLMARTEAMGLVDVVEGRFDETMLRRSLVALSRAGIGRTAISRLEQGHSVGPVLALLNDEVADTPSPDTEWPTIIGLLTSDVLASLLGISMSSLQRYQSGDRATPEKVADRLHFLSLVVADLLGAYNQYGVRRWFERPRSTLDGASPRAALSGEWTSQDDAAQRVAALAHSLVTMNAT